MSDYHIDQDKHAQIVQHLRDMDAVLQEVAVTYQLLASLLEQQAETLRAPVLNKRGEQLLTAVKQADRRAAAIAGAVQALVDDNQRVAERIQALETDV